MSAISHRTTAAPILAVLTLTAALATASVLGLAAPAAAASSTITVGPSAGDDYSTIQDAVDAASAGDTISVDPGLYTESVDITVPLTLVGSGAATTTVLGTMALNAPVDLSGFTLEGQATVPDESPSNPTTLQIWAGGAGSDVHDNVLANGYQDVYAQGVVGSSANTTVIQNNTIRDFHADQGTGVWIANSSYFEVKGNVIVDGTPIDDNATGINLVCGASNIDIASNTISNVGNAIVDIANGACDSSSQVSIEGNTVSGTSGSALYFGANNLTGISIAGNTIRHVGGSGGAIVVSGNSMWLASSGIPVSGFVVSGNATSDAPNGLVVGDGVALAGNSSVASEGNTYCSTGDSIENLTTGGFTVSSANDDFCSTSAGPGVLVDGPTSAPSPAASKRATKTSTAVKAATVTVAATEVDPGSALAVTGDTSTGDGSSSSTTPHKNDPGKVLTSSERRAAAGFPLWLGILLAVLAALVIFFVSFFAVRRRDA